MMKCLLIRMTQQPRPMPTILIHFDERGSYNPRSIAGNGFHFESNSRDRHCALRLLKEVAVRRYGTSCRRTQRTLNRCGKSVAVGVQFLELFAIALREDE